VPHLVGSNIAAPSQGEGQAATFVRLPVAVATRAPAERPAAATADAPVDGSLTGLHILVVDDEVDAREVMRFMLEGEIGAARLRATGAAPERAGSAGPSRAAAGARVGSPSRSARSARRCRAGRRCSRRRGRGG
jgi:hypothetical protein